MARRIWVDGGPWLRSDRAKPATKLGLERGDRLGTMTDAPLLPLELRHRADEPRLFDEEDGIVAEAGRATRAARDRSLTDAARLHAPRRIGRIDKDDHTTEPRAAGQRLVARSAQIS